METDGIVIHSATTLSDNPQLLDKATITVDDKVIYICGHGNLEEHTIGGRKMPEIAKLLERAGYNGIQTIYITSCNSATKHNNSTMVMRLKDSLRDVLNKKLDEDIHNGIIKEAERGKYTENIYNIVVESQSDVSSIVLKDENAEAEIWVIKQTSFINHAVIYIKNIKQKRYLKSIGAGKLEINIDNFEKDISKHMSSIGDRIRWYKNRLVISEVMKHHEVEALNFISLMYTWMISMLFFIILGIIKIPMNYKEVALISLSVILITEGIKIIIVGKGDYEKLNLIIILQTMQGIAFSLIAYNILMQINQ